MTKAILLAIPLLGCTAAPSAPAPADKLDPILAAHPEIGRDYVAAVNAGVRIPRPFWGEWSSDPATCGLEGDDGDTRLWVDAVTVSYYGQTHVVTKVAEPGTRSITLTYGVLKQGYHGTTAPARLFLSADGQTLAREPGGASGWARCPTAD